MAKRLPSIVKDNDKKIREVITSTKEIQIDNSRSNVLEQDKKDYSITLENHDEAIKWYFENKILPEIELKSKIKVPVIYGTPERWKSVQEDGYYRDKNGKLMAPVIMFKRTNIGKDRTLGNKLDANKVNNYQVFKKHYNKRNQYDAFSVLSNRIPSEEYILSIVPDYVNLSYSCLIFTDYVQHINSLIESINYASDAYWGDFGRFRFRVMIDQFMTEVEVTDGVDRAVKCEFNLSVNGYIIPDSVNKKISANDLKYSKAQIVFNTEVLSSADSVVSNTNQPFKIGASNLTTFIDSQNNIDPIIRRDMEYINTNITKIASDVGRDTATFVGSFIQPSSGSTLPLTSKDNFVFYANGLNIPSHCVISFIDNNDNSCTLTINPSLLQYYLFNKEITAIGKWQE